MLRSSASAPAADPPSPEQTRRDPEFNAAHGITAAGREFPFPALDDAIAAAEAALRTDEHSGTAGMVYVVRTRDGRSVTAQTELRSVGKYGAGYIPGRIQTDEPVARLLPLRRETNPRELRILAPGYERLTRRVILRPADMVIWDDLVLEPTTWRSGVRLAGRVFLENNEDPEGLVVYVDDEAVAFTDHAGLFAAGPVRSGELRVSAYKPGFVGLNATVETQPGSDAVCEMHGYLERFAHIRWAFQSNGSRDLDDGVVSGVAVLSLSTLNRVSFGRQLQQVNTKSDFLLMQKGDELVIKNFDAAGHDRPAFVVLDGASFEDVREAPAEGYGQSARPLRAGAVYVFRCYDGRSYAKLEVIRVSDERPSSRR